MSSVAECSTWYCMKCGGLFCRAVKYNFHPGPIRFYITLENKRIICAQCNYRYHELCGHSLPCGLEGLGVRGPGIVIIGGNCPHARLVRAVAASVLGRSLHAAVAAQPAIGGPPAPPAAAAGAVPLAAFPQAPPLAFPEAPAPPAAAAGAVPPLAVSPAPLHSVQEISIVELREIKTTDRCIFVLNEAPLFSNVFYQGRLVINDAAFPPATLSDRLIPPGSEGWLMTWEEYQAWKLNPSVMPPLELYYRITPPKEAAAGAPPK